MKRTAATETAPGTWWARLRAARNDPALAHGHRAQLRAKCLRSTTAHLCSAYPWSVEGSLGHRGAYMGIDRLSGDGPMFWDPFEAYEHLPGGPTNPNVLIAGAPGKGKSALIKTALWRTWGIYGTSRWFSILDPKSEYATLAERIGAQRLVLAPGGPTRINPLASGPNTTQDHEARVRRHYSLLRALCAIKSTEALGQEADAVLHSTAQALNAHPGRTPSLVDARDLLDAPTAEILAAARFTNDEHARRVTRPLVLSLNRLLSQELRGMFDATDAAAVDWSAPGLVVDLSPVFDDEEVLSVVMIAAVGWLSELMSTPGPRRIQIFDEVWALLRDPAATRHLQRCFKLGRTYGVTNIAVCHKASDLTAQSDDGTALSKIAGGLLADTATKILLGQEDGELPFVADAFGLTDRQIELVGRFQRGESLWQIGDRSAHLRQHIGEHEWPLIDTDQRMRAQP